ncbi:hypothetical protein DFP72DRAFT_1141462 [Ephemerocybe angulata]|uniref:OTU domain-containing protein n=1 Tax=Ephemerocybe angulata TaxID=980116 RepID=A0A8H6HMM0_9AGAR|nr:hypothetical protein DFP72DRAFT_1141462 [Tulosesus angulatus]
MGKTHRKQQILSARSRTTRSHKPRLLLSDPTESSAHLTAQLRALGLYAANTLGDGNCLFRALSDQLYGSHTKHSALRQAVCAFIEANKARYAPFCEDERGLDVHLRCMRENGTYGGHLELSAFAHMVKRNVKVVQPGLVYVIEWGAGLDAEEREVELGRRRKEEEREREREGFVMCVGTVYVAYHDWEHFSSIRNLNGPHAGLPNVVETPADDEDDDEEEEEIPVRRDPKKERGRERKEKEKEKRDKMRRITKVKLKLSAPPSTTNTPPPEPAPAAMSIDTLSSLSSLSSLTSGASTPAPSPSPAPTSVPLSTISSSSSPPAAAPTLSTVALSTVAAAALPAFRVHRSPKRSFDESASSEDGQSVVSDDVERGRGRDKRSRMGSVVGAADLAASGEVDGEASGEADGEVDGDEVDGKVDGGVDGEEVDGKVEEPPASQVSAGSVGMEGVEGERDEEEEKEEAEVVAAIALGGAAAQEIVDEGYSSLSSLSDSEDDDDARGEQSDDEDEDEDADEGEDKDGDEEHGYEEEGEEEEGKDTGKATLKANGKKGKKGKGAMEKQVHLGEDGKPLTRKQRKQLGLPKFRGVLAHAKGVSAGRIVIPGGRFKGRAGAGVGVGVNGGGTGVGGKDEEWVKTGVGRVDVRGFRELKI